MTEYTDATPIRASVHGTHAGVAEQAQAMVDRDTDHVASPGELDARERAELWELLDHALQALERTLKPHGANAGLNLGRTAGAGIEGHLHLHVVPRWNGDTNFMPVLADTRVMAQHLDDSWRLITEAWVPSQP